MFSCRLNFKNRGPVFLFKTIDLGTETASYNKNEHELKLTKNGSTSSSFIASTLPCLVLPDKNLFDVFFCTGVFCLSV